MEINGRDPIDELQGCRRHATQWRDIVPRWKSSDEVSWLAVYAHLVHCWASSLLDSLKRALVHGVCRRDICNKRLGIQLQNPLPSR